jgi:hypothetical protein
MSMRGLVVALLCGLLGLGGGALVAYAVQPRPTYGDLASPVPGVSPSLPTNPPPPTKSHAQDITYPVLNPYLPLTGKYTIRNQLAVWHYHVPQGWTAYSECLAPPAPCSMPNDTVLTGRKRIDRQSQLVFRPSHEPLLGGYLIRVAALDNSTFNVGQTVATKIEGFRQQRAQTGEQFHVLKRTPTSVYFTYVALPSHRLRYNYFQWFAVQGQPNATLEMSVAGRSVDVPGLKALFNRFADDVVGSVAQQAQKTP